MVQTLFALGILLGYPLLFPSLDTGTISCTSRPGHPRSRCITMGLVAVPQVGRAGTHRGDPGLHAQPAAATPDLSRGRCLDWLVIVLPGVVLAIAIAVWHFRLDLVVSPLVIPALLLVALTATSIGYAIASLLPQQSRRTC